MITSEIYNSIVARALILLGVLPEVGEPMTDRAWDCATSLSVILTEWRKARDEHADPAYSPVGQRDSDAW